MEQRVYVLTTAAAATLAVALILSLLLLGVELGYEAWPAPRDDRAAPSPLVLEAPDVDATGRPATSGVPEHDDDPSGVVAVAERPAPAPAPSRRARETIERTGRGGRPSALPPPSAPVTVPVTAVVVSPPVAIPAADPGPRDADDQGGGQDGGHGRDRHAESRGGRWNHRPENPRSGPAPSTIGASPDDDGHPGRRPSHYGSGHGRP